MTESSVTIGTILPVIRGPDEVVCWFSVVFSFLGADVSMGAVGPSGLAVSLLPVSIRSPMPFMSTVMLDDGG